MSFAKTKRFEVKATAGDTHLGGQDFTNRLADYCLKEFSKKTGHPELAVRKNDRSMKRLNSACDQVKKALSNAENASVEVDAIFAGDDLCVAVSRAKFEQLNNELFERSMRSVERVMKGNYTFFLTRNFKHKFLVFTHQH